MMMTPPAVTCCCDLDTASAASRGRGGAGALAWGEDELVESLRDLVGFLDDENLVVELDQVLELVGVHDAKDLLLRSRSGSPAVDLGRSRSLSPVVGWNGNGSGSGSPVIVRV
jgi:hypothetical protein